MPIVAPNTLWSLGFQNCMMTITDVHECNITIKEETTMQKLQNVETKKNNKEVKAVKLNIEKVEKQAALICHHN